MHSERATTSLTCTLAMLCLVTQAVAGQDRRVIAGIVKDAQNGETLPYASVVVEGTMMGAAANVDGRFAIVDVPEGVYTLTVNYLGYQSTTIEVNTAALASPLVIALTASAVYLDEMLVVADYGRQLMKAGGTVSHAALSPKEAAVLPNVGEVDIFRALQLMPGISGTNEGSSGLFVRGGTPDQNLILFDGMTVYHVDHFFGFFSAFNADAIKDVQIYKGGFPAIYGGRTSSVVDLTGRTGGNDFGVGVGLNLLSSAVALELPLGERSSFLVTGRRSYTDILQTGLYNNIYQTLTGDDDAAGPAGQFRSRPGGGALGGRLRNDGSAVVQPDFHFYDINAKLNFQATSRDVLAISFYGGKDNLDESRYLTIDPAGGQQAGITSDIYDVTGWGNLGASGKWSRQWSPQFYTNALIAYARYFSDSTRDQLFERNAPDADTLLFSRRIGTREDNRLVEGTLRFDSEWQASQAHRVGIGAQVTATSADYRHSRDDTLVFLDEHASARQWAVYIQDQWRPVTRLHLTAGLRTAHYERTGTMYFEPRTSFRYDLTDRLRVKGAFGRYHQFVARVVNENITEGARDFWLLADDDQVQVQGATHVVLGLAFETPAWLVDLEAYRKHLSGLSEYSLRFRRSGVDFQADELFFDGGGIGQGVELLVQKKAGRITGWASYTWSRIEHTFDGLNAGKAFPALHDQSHELEFVGSARLGRRWTAAATWIFGTGRPYTLPESQYTLTMLDGAVQSFIHVGDKNGERLPAYHRLDTAVHYRLPVGRWIVDFGLSVFNLYNRSNVWYKEFDLTESPFVTTDVTFLGFTPNLSVRVDL